MKLRRRRHRHKCSRKDLGILNLCVKHRVRAPTDKGRRPSLSRLITSLLKASFDLFQPDCHGHNQHFHLERETAFRGFKKKMADKKRGVDVKE